MTSDMKVPYISLPLQHQAIKSELLRAVEQVLDHGCFILGPEVAAFEKSFAEYCGARYAVGVDSGTSALYLAMRALGIGPGDEVITTPNPFLASASSIALAGARPVFVDVRDDYNLNPQLLEAAITPRTRAIIPVHLTGRPADMYPIMEIAQRHSLYVIEDCAQAVGARYHGQPVGTFGGIGCFSLHPMKTLNAVGDGGIVITKEESIYHYLLKARNHGFRNKDECEFWSHNCRLDTLHAAMLMIKMKYLDKWTKARRANAKFYQARLRNFVKTPEDKPYEYAVYHAFFIQANRRDELQLYLKERGIETIVHHRIPIHLQEGARSLGYSREDFPVAEQQCRRILSLPVFPELTAEQKEHVVHSIQEFYV